MFFQNTLFSNNLSYAVQVKNFVILSKKRLQALQIVSSLLAILTFHLCLLVSTLSYGQAASHSVTQMAAMTPVNVNRLPATTETWIHIQGSNTVGARLTPAIAVEFLRSKGLQDVVIQQGRDAYDKYIKGFDPINNKMVQIHIESYGSSTGFKAFMSGNTDIGASSRPIKRKEIDKLKRLGNMTASSSEHVIGIDGLAIVVHPENKIKSLTVKQVALLFSGAISNWAQLGGADLPVSIHARDDESGTWDTFKGLVLAKKYKLHAAAKRYVSNDELSQQVSIDRGGIGFVGLSSVGRSKLIAIADGDNSPAMYPTRLTVGTEDYPLARRLFLYTPPLEKIATDKPIVKEFIEFALGQMGQSLVDEIGYISQNIQQHKLAIKENLPGYYRQAVSDADRLSLNFRFKEGKAKLDNKAFADVKRLVDFMSQKENEGKKLILVGASDPRLKNEYAVLLSKLRAKVVRKQLISEGISRRQIEVIANGALLQVAGNESLTSRIKNRRVEVWIQ